MAEALGHRFGQIVGEVLETAIQPVLQAFAKKYDLYLDKKGYRRCRTGRKCAWVDHNGNSHDLDFVLERGGSSDKHGIPTAFIETAWRRYTKHSRNKAQEIQGAIEPLAETFRHARPFKGAVLAGVFTDGALTQLRSLGFSVLHFPYSNIVAAFQRFGIDAAFDENTPDSEFERKVQAFERLSPDDRARLSEELVRTHETEVKEFVTALESAVMRQVQTVIILALHGKAHEVKSIQEAIKFIDSYEDVDSKPVERYEIQVRYNNGDTIEGRFKDKASAIEFLTGFIPPAR